jgi:transcriptional regulator with XRE-family HTH domain
MASYETKIIFSQNLSRLLNHNQITQLELANKMGVAASTVSSWCNGEKMPRMDKVEWMAQFFGVPTTSLIEPFESQKQIDLLDEVDLAFYGEYKELTEDDKETVRDMVRVMRERRAKKQEK